MSTELDLYGTRSIDIAYPGCYLPENVTPKQMRTFLVKASQYTGGEVVPTDQYCSVKFANGEEKVQKIAIWGMLCYRKQIKDTNRNGMIDTFSGEVQSAMKDVIGVVFKVTAPGENDKYLSFSGISVWKFVERSILPMIQMGMLSMGDWDEPLYLVIRKKPLEVGHVYLMQLIEDEDE